MSKISEWNLKSRNNSLKLSPPQKTENDLLLECIAKDAPETNDTQKGSSQRHPGLPAFLDIKQPGSLLD